MAELKASVVIPTYNNAQILPECLRRILEQTLSREEYEVLVVNDGSADETKDVLNGLAGSQIRVWDDSVNQGPSYARNLGIREALAPLIVFIQDDILVRPDFLERHLKFHQEHSEISEVLVGHTRFDQDLPLTPFMRWWEGKQFRFEITNNKKQITSRPYLNFYPTNLSIKKEFLVKKGMFDEDFFIDGHIGYEDTELGYRLWQAGMKLYYDPSLQVLHYHLRTLKDICDQSYYKGRLAKILYRKHPKLQKVFRDDLKFNLTRGLVNPFTIKLLEPLAYYCENRLRFGVLFWLVCRYHYNQGYKNL